MRFSNAVPLASRILVTGLISALAGCAGLPAGVDRQPSSAYVDTGDTRIARAIAGAVAAHPGKTGVLPLLSGREAFAARMTIARAADRSLDVQYYIWHADTTGNLIFEALWQAAERGVRVRLLLDDQNTGGLDPTLAALDSHPNIEVRLFNPFASRSFRIGDYTHSFARLNRRMHNKSFTADNQVAIVGGRNIGDEYFEAGTPVAFADLDTVVEGAVVRDVSVQFDAYWNSESAYPLVSLVAAADASGTATVRDAWSRLSASPAAAEYLDAVRETALVQQLAAGNLALEWVSARLVSDDPAKVLHPPERREMQMGPRLQAAMGQPSAEMDLVSPYFVPTQEGTNALVAIAARGVRVRVLTNSLAATDVAPVYAGYVKYREALLRGGVQLFELKPQRDERPHGKVGTSSGASLHAKTFAIDRSRIFIGSFNLDPRSARLNTEVGVVLESPTLATQLSEAFDRTIPSRAYEVRLTPDGKGVEWIEQTSAGEVRHSSTPGASASRMFFVNLLRILPIEWLL
jgi:putative cardiolipin synthase